MWGGERVVAAEGPGKIGGQFLRSSPLSATLCLVTLPLHLPPPPPHHQLHGPSVSAQQGSLPWLPRHLTASSPRKSDLPLSAPKLTVSGNEYGKKRRESEGLSLFRFGKLA